MEEDIKVLEEKIKLNRKDFENEGYHCCFDEETMQLVENLINRNKELEDTLNDLVQVKQDVGSISYTMPSKLAKASIEVLVNSGLKIENEKLKKENIELNDKLQMTKNSIVIGNLDIVEDYIPKSKVREKITQIKMKADYDWLFKYDYKDVIDILQELLQEGDDK